MPQSPLYRLATSRDAVIKDALRTFFGNARFRPEDVCIRCEVTALHLHRSGNVTVIFIVPDIEVEEHRSWRLESRYTISWSSTTWTARRYAGTPGVPHGLHAGETFDWKPRASSWPHLLQLLAGERLKPYPSRLGRYLCTLGM